MTDLAKQIRDALAGLAAQHGIDDSAPARETEQRDYFPAVTRRPASSDMRDGLARLREPQPVSRRDLVSKSDRDAEGRYATVSFADGYVTVYVDTVEKRSTGIKAYVLRLDTRQRVYVTLDHLTELRDSE